MEGGYGGQTHFNGEQEFYIEEEVDDDNHEEQDIVLLSDDAIPRELGVKKGNKLFNAIP